MHGTRQAARRGSLATTVLLSSAAFLLTSSANAYKLLGSGCRYDPKNDDDGLGIGFDTGGSLCNATERLSIEYAASNWNARVTPQLAIVEYGSSSRDLRVQWANLGPSTGDRMTYWCGSSHYTQDPLFEYGANATYYSSTQARRIAIGVHEIGHSYGVDHNNTTGCGAKTAGLMHKGAVAKTDLGGWTAPTIDDVNRAVDAHNG